MQISITVGRREIEKMKRENQASMFSNRGQQGVGGASKETQNIRESTPSLWPLTKGKVIEKEKKEK